MKRLIILGDGMADRPIPSLHDKTPLEQAFTPNMDKLASRGEFGLVHTLLKDFPFGSDIANMTVLGYDPKQYYTGRAPLEAAANGVRLAPTDMAMRINLVSLLDGKMNHYASGHIGDDEADALIDTLQHNLNSDEFTIHKGSSYRHLLVWHDGPDGLKLTPPHDISGQAIKNYLPCGPQSEALSRLMDKATLLFKHHPINKTRLTRGDLPVSTIWPWGEGRKPTMPTIWDRFAIKGAVISAVDLIFGLGHYAGLTRIDVDGATGYTDTNYSGKADATLAALEAHDFVFLHIEAPDEASHEGDLEAKIKAIETIDKDVIGPILEGLAQATRILLMPDHATPIELRTHTNEPVPYCLTDMMKPAHLDKRSNNRQYCEKQAGETGIVHKTGHTLIEKLFA